MTQITTILAMLLLGGVAFGRNEPQDMPIFSDSQVVGPVEVVREQQYSGSIRLVVKYKNITEANETPITANIRMFYWEETRSMPLLLTKVEDHFEARISNGCLVGQFAGCAVYGTQEMRHLLFWAIAPKLQLNTLNFELSFADANYQFGFPQHNSL